MAEQKDDKCKKCVCNDCKKSCKRTRCIYCEQLAFKTECSFKNKKGR